MRNSRRHRFAVLALCSGALLIGCGGGLPETDLSSQYAGKPVTLSYEPSVGREYSYLSTSSVNQELSFGRGSWSFQVRGDRKLDMTVVGLDDAGTTQMRVKYGEASASIFRHGRELEAEEALKLARRLTGRSLNVWIKSDGALEKWGGLKGLGWGENEADMGEMTANTFVTSFLVLPQEPVSLGHEWKRKFEMPIKTKTGDMMIVSRQNYSLEKIVNLGPHLCARISYEVLQTFEGEGDATVEGKQVFYRIDGEGEGAGTIYFDLDNGMVVRKVTQTNMEYEISTTEAQSGEEESSTVHEFSKEEIKLVEK
jgi:hypothetical protein